MDPILTHSLTLAGSIVGAVGLVALFSRLSDWLDRRRAARRVLVVLVAEQREQAVEYAREQLGGETERRWIH